jgi:aryl-alcohol dehydrogenase-like predicted oxidoreductase
MLGGSGCAVSSLCLGTMTFGVETDEPGAHQQLDRFIEAGGTLVDTADVYGGGRSEEIIGRWFASRPADVTEPVVLATLHLTAAETAALDAASDPHPVDYPYGELGVEQRARTLPAGH